MADFAERLEAELKRRYDVCEDYAATPSSILLAVLNAVAEARKEPTAVPVAPEAAPEPSLKCPNCDDTGEVMWEAGGRTTIDRCGCQKGERRSGKERRKSERREVQEPTPDLSDWRSGRDRRSGGDRRKGR